MEYYTAIKMNNMTNLINKIVHEDKQDTNYGNIFKVEE